MPLRWSGVFRIGKYYIRNNEKTIEGCSDKPLPEDADMILD